MAEGQILFDAISVGFIDLLRSTQRTAAVRAFAREQVASSGAGAHDLAFGGDFEPLGNSLARFDSFWASHKSTNSLKNEREI